MIGMISITILSIISRPKKTLSNLKSYNHFTISTLSQVIYGKMHWGTGVFVKMYVPYLQPLIFNQNTYG